MYQWSHLAEPRDDGLDTRALLALAKENAIPGFAFYAPPTPPPRHICNGRVIVGPAVDQENYTGFVHAPADHPNIDADEEMLRVWPAAHAQFGELITWFNPVMAPNTFQNGSFIKDAPSCSGCRASSFGLLTATIEHPTTLAEAWVHEMAHQKLFAMGIDMEYATRFILNHHSELYVSPVIRNKPRPMSAVLHAQYSFVHIAALDVCMFLEYQKSDMAGRLLALLGYALVRIEEGIGEIRRHARLDEEGRLFMDGFHAWTERVIEQGNHILRDVGYAKPELPPPSYQTAAPTS